MALVNKLFDAKTSNGWYKRIKLHVQQPFFFTTLISMAFRT